MNLQDKRIADGIRTAEAPFDLNVPRPETRELDDIIKALETQIEDLGVPDEGTTFVNTNTVPLSFHSADDAI